MTAYKELLKEYSRVRKELPPNIAVRPQEQNLLVWHFVFKGPESTPFEGGFYHGKLEFPEDFPTRAPVFRMITPNGRFKPHWRICVDPQMASRTCGWSDKWPVSTLLHSVLCFMQDDTDSYGSMLSTEEDKRLLAKKSLLFNLNDDKFVELFPDIANEIRSKLGCELPLEDDSTTDDELENQGETAINKPMEAEIRSPKNKSLHVRFQEPENELGERRRDANNEEDEESFEEEDPINHKAAAFDLKSLGAPAEPSRESQIHHVVNAEAGNNERHRQMMRVVWFMMLLSFFIKLCLEIFEDISTFLE